MEGQVNKSAYIKAWNSRIDDFGILRWVNDIKLSREVNKTMDKMRELVERVAEDKGLKEASN